MITRIHGASSTLAANPRKKHHKRKAAHHSLHANPGKRRKGKKRAKKRAKMTGWRRVSRKLETKILRKRGKLKRTRVRARTGKIGVALPPALIKKRRSKAYRRMRAKYSVFSKKVKGKRVYRVRKNPALVIAGVPVIEMAIGSVAAITLGHTVTKLAARYAKDKLPAFLGNAETGIIGELATAGLAAFVYMKGPQQPMVKEVSKYAFIGAVFQAISKLASKPIGDALENVLPKATGGYHTAGIYFDPYTATAATGGAYLTTDGHTDMSGMYTSVDGLGLFQSPSIYG